MVVKAGLGKNYNKTHKRARQAIVARLEENIIALHRLHGHALRINKAIRSNRLQDITVETVEAAKKNHGETTNLYSNQPRRKTTKSLEWFDPICLLQDFDVIEQLIPNYAWPDTKSVIYSCECMSKAVGITYQAIAVYFHYPKNARRLRFFWIGHADERGSVIKELESTGFNWNEFSPEYVEWWEEQRKGPREPG